MTMEKRGDAWVLSSPLEYPANRAAVEPIVAALAGLEITASAPADDRMLQRMGLDPDHAIEVKAWAGDRVESHFRVGRAGRDETYVQRVGDARVLTVRGKCRRIFDKSVDELRDPVITDFDVTKIERVTYASPDGAWELVADDRAPGRFVAKGAPIRNFDGERASKNVAVLAHLVAKGLVDAPASSDVTGLLRDDTPRATLFVRTATGLTQVHVWVGARTPDGRLHLRRSQSEQIYLVSSHLESSLVPRRSQLERSDAMVRELRARAKERTAPGETAHSHAHPSELPGQVPNELLRELRALAADQLAR
jgi:hypothetical protein